MLNGGVNTPTAADAAPNAPRDVTLVIFGASGDLTKRLLLPGLGTLLKGSKAFRVTLIGAAIDDVADDAWTKTVREALSDGGLSASRIDDIASRTRYEKLDVTDPDVIGPFVADLPSESVLYFALPPAITMKACSGLKADKLPQGIKFALEKPFGTSGASAHAFNKLLLTLVDENQIFRVDHFLGRGTVLNLLGLRFTNRIFEPVWNGDNVESVHILFDESLSLEGRARYYDHSGALRDMIQSHLLLVMAMVAMEEIASIDEVEVRDLMAHTMRATTLWTGDPITSSRRARYLAGEVNGKQIPNYTDEPGVDPANNTETLAEVDLRIDNERWSGVKFTLRSGKALGDGRYGITLHFRPVSHVPKGFVGEPVNNVIDIGMKPQTLAVQVSTNGAGDDFDLEETVLSTTLAESTLRPYGEILELIFEGNPLLSVRGDIAEECWRIVEPVLDAFAANRVPMATYRAGWAGPADWQS